MKKKIIPIFIPHQGCPNDCVFCNQKRITGKSSSIDFNEIHKDIVNSLLTIKKDAQIEIAFFGGSFTAIDLNIQKRCLEIANDFMARDSRILDIRISTRPDAISEEILSFVKLYKVTIIELGVQSLDDEVLISSDRGHDSSCVYSSSKLIKEYGFKLGLQMMVGLPNDTYDKVVHTAKEFVKIKPDYVRIYPVLVIKDTKLEERLNNREYKALNIEETIEIVKKVFLLLTYNNIKVIRIGLQATYEINYNESIVGGPFHPSFGELIFSRLYRDFIELMIKENSLKAGIIVEVNNSLVSQIIGNKKQNLTYFKENFDADIKVKTSNLIDIDHIKIGSNIINKNQIYENLLRIYF